VESSPASETPIHPSLSFSNNDVYIYVHTYIHMLYVCTYIHTYVRYAMVMGALHCMMQYKEEKALDVL
jgi:hypothetical protein